jgi:uncharacterized protein (TIGR04255 family)
MGFQPYKDGHAIAEVVFGLVFDRVLSPMELGAFFAAHSKFQEKLPGKSQIASVPILFGGAPVAVQGSGVSFDRFGRAGNIEQRLRLEANAAFVNSLQYSRWAEVSSEAYSLLDEALNSARQAAIGLTGVVLQYVDVFEWQGDLEDYDLKTLLNENRSYFPGSIFERGHLWHLHQGWYRNDDLPTGGRLLERISTDGILNEFGRPIVRLDSNLSFEFDAARTFVAMADNPSSGVSISRVFDFLHDENKEIMGNCLTDTIRKKIGL